METMLGAGIPELSPPPSESEETPPRMLTGKLEHLPPHGNHEVAPGWYQRNLVKMKDENKILSLIT